MSKKIKLLEVKQACKDRRFRDKLGPEFKDHIAKYLQNPNCTCNMPFFKKLLKDAVPQLMEYFPDHELDEAVAIHEMAAIEAAPVPSNPLPSGLFKKESDNAGFELPPYEFSYVVINCHINELAQKLGELPRNNPKQISLARYEDQVTCIVNEVPQPVRRQMAAR